MTDIVTIQSASEAAAALAARFGDNKLVRLEGFCGCGKSTIAGFLSREYGAAHIEGDKFAVKPDAPRPYQACIRQREFDQAIDLALVERRVVVLDAVCLDAIAPTARWGRGLLVYVKRLSFNNPYAPIWHGGLNLEDAPPACEPHKSVHRYHLSTRPHENADVIVEMPEEGHFLYPGPFSRGMCFDPKDAKSQIP